MVASTVPSTGHRAQGTRHVPSTGCLLFDLVCISSDCLVLKDPLIDWIADFLIGCIMKVSVSGIRNSFIGPKDT